MLRLRRALAHWLLPRVTVHSVIAPGLAEVGRGEEKRLIDRRCRCGRYAAELHRECAWHDSASAQYAATLLAVLKAVEAVAPGTLAAAAQYAADDAELAEEPWFRAGLADYRAGRVRKA